MAHHVSVFLNTADLTAPATASGEVGNNRPEQRKRVIFNALTNGTAKHDVGEARWRGVHCESSVVYRVHRYAARL